MSIIRLPPCAHLISISKKIVKEIMKSNIMEFTSKLYLFANVTSTHLKI